MKRSLIYCISIILVIVLLSVSAFAATITDSGMEASPYLITNEAELQQLETNVKYGKSYSGKYFRGSNDITLTQAWTPIGTASTPFCGIFDGNGKTISAMTVSGDHSALFAYIGSGAMDSYTGSDMPWSQHITDIQKVVIEAGVTAIGNYTFTRCAELGSITPSQRVNTLGDDAYSKCAGLTEGKQYSLGNEVLVSQTEIPATGHIATGPDGIDVPADTLQPDCTTSIQCNICGKVVLAALGHRVVGTGTVVVDPLTIDNTADAPFLLSGSRYTSSNKSDNSSSNLNITAQYDCALTLDYGVSSEVYYDKLLILLNDAEQVDISGEKSGTTTLTLSAGDMVTVRYQKDSSNNIGKDEGWVELVYDKFEVETQVDIPADQAEPDCTNAVVCHYCNTVVKEALGHRVYIDSVPENPLVIDNTSAYPFSEEDGVYTSTNKNHSTTSELTITVAHPGTLKLLYGVSSEIYYDYMYILHKDRRTVFDGDSSDLTLELDVKTGDVIIIGYLKDSSNSSGSDCCWVSWEYTADPLLVPADSVQADCSTDLTCDICQALIKPAGHTEVVDKAVAATCTEAGLTEGKHCSVCGEVLVAQNIVDALGHTPAAAVEENRVESTCTVAGSYEEVVYCSACNAELSRETKALELAAHTPGEAVVENNVDATCGVDGSYDSVVHCSVCTTHVISSTHVVVPATGNHDWTDGQCTVCQKVCEHNYVNGTCSVCGDQEPSAVIYDTELTAIEVSFDAEIKLWMYFIIPDALLNDDAAYVLVTKDGAFGEVKTKVTMAQLREQGPTTYGDYLIEQPVASGEMGRSVTVQIVDGNGNYANITDYVDGSVGNAVSRTVADYARNRFEKGTAKQKKLVAAMLVYGGYSQVKFKVDASNPVYNILPEYGYEIPDLSDISAANIDQEMVISDTSIGLTYTAQEAFLDSAIYHRVYFALDSGAVIDNYTFEIDLIDVKGNITTVEVEPGYDAKYNEYYVDIPDIPAAYLDHMYTVTVTNNLTKETYEVVTSVLVWTKRIMSNPKNPLAQINLAKATYYYNQAANEFFGK